MPFNIVRNDITKMEVDAIVNAANSSLTGGGGVDGAIHRAAGRMLLNECIALKGCNTGEAKITKGYNLKAKHVIHTVGPIWRDGNCNEEKLLEECYRNSLKLAKENNLESVAFPLISTGAYRFPKDKALFIATKAIEAFLLENDMMIYLVVFDKTSVTLSEKLFISINEFIDDNYIDEDRIDNRYVRELQESYCEECNFSIEEEKYSIPQQSNSLADVLNNMDESFSKMLLRKIDQKDMKDSEVYKKANIDRRLFSKIRKDIDYKPSKITAVALAIALELNLDETQDLLLKAGYALSNSNKFDVIIKYFISEKNYNIFEINEALFTFEEKLLVS